ERRIIHARSTIGLRYSELRHLGEPVLVQIQVERHARVQQQPPTQKKTRRRRNQQYQRIPFLLHKTELYGAHIVLCLRATASNATPNGRETLRSRRSSSAMICASA